LDVFAPIEDKKAFLMDYCVSRRYELKKIVYIGNDLNDLEAMKIVGWPIAPIDAHSDVISIAKVVTQCRGGEGVVREFSEMLIRN
jgi:3-deoxy-D-manno-octulosonate 8-phosphate phosphatase (KDO 8-P phosphatase)